MPVKIGLGIFCVIESACFLLQYLGFVDRNEFNVAGHFDNVTGLAICLSISIPVFLHGFKHLDTLTKYLMSICVMVCVVSVLFTKSRIGIIYIIICFIAKFLQVKNKRLIIVLAAVSLATIAAFLFKTESTTGRFFILSQALVLIMKSPFGGWGTKGFESQYMNVQADYFSSHPQSQFAYYADNIRHPLNEFLYIATNYGLISLFVLCFCIFLVYKYFQKNKTEDGKLGIEILTGIIVFSMFSYPFHYIFIWIMFIYALILIFKNVIKRKLIGRWVIGVGMVFLLSFGYWKTKQIFIEKEWLDISEKSQYKSFESILPEYQRLYVKMNDNSFFLYNYAFVLREAGYYDEALKIAEKCQQMLADYDLSLLLGDIHSELKHVDEALSYYMLAHHMCPNRFAPLCAIYDLYKSQGDREKCLFWVKEIMNKPIKTPSRETMEYVNYIRTEAKKYCL